jgi:hypothetical protein
MNTLCLFCNAVVIGRSDKKFCDDQCRSSHFQKIKSKDPDLFHTINKVLKNNRRILSKLNPTGKTKISRTSLMAAGFDLNYHTHFYKTQAGSIYFFCYEFGYLELLKDEFLLVKKEQKI